MVRIFILLLTTLLFTFQVKSQTIFQETIPFYSASGATKDFTLTDDGGYVILRINVGISDNRNYLHLTKTNSQGALQWVNAFALQNILNSGEGIGGLSVKQTADGGYIITGISILAGNAEIFLIKTNSIGSLVWNKYYGSQSTDDYGNDVLETSDGGFLVIGTNNVSNAKLWLIKTNSIGSVIWQRIIWPAGGASNGFSVKQANSGEYYIFGNTSSTKYVIKTDLNGNTIWSKSYGTDGSLNYGEPTLDGGCILVYNGSVTLGSSTQLLKINLNGNVEWSKNYHTSGLLTDGNCIRQTFDKGFIVCGASNGFGTNKTYGTLLKTDSLGNINFYRMYGGPKSSFKVVKQTADEGYAAVGDSSEFIYIIKTDSLGMSGCSEATQTVSISTQTVSATSTTLNNTAGTSFSPGSLSIISASLALSSVIPHCLTVGLVDVNNYKTLKIFPNPTNGLITIQIGNNTKNSKLKLINIIGDVIMERTNISDENYTINIDNQSNGIYLLELNQNGIISRTKFIKN